MKKRIFSLILTLSFIVSFANFSAFANDYADNWASEAISALIRDNIVSGDNSGNVNPDMDIKRSEFVKVVNKIMGYTNKAGENFKDVSENAWYYNEFLIAKGNSVISGDDKGNANPENNITREEAFKIISTILNLTEETDIVFSDEENISDWAAPYIKRVVKSGLVKGYSDGTVKPKNNIKRAEAFYILNSVRSLKTETGNEVVNEPSNAVPPISIGGGSSSGGGSSGGSTNTVKIKAPVITYTNGCVIGWTTVKDAKSYTVYVTYKGETLEKNVDASETSLDLSGEIAEICEGTRGVDEIEVSVSICTKSKSGKMSDESKKATISVNVDEILSSADLGLTVSYKTVNDIRGFFVDWTDDTVTKIVVKADDEDIVYKNPVKPLDITKEIVTEGFIYKVIATADSGKDIKNVTLADSYFDGGDGTSGNPYIISQGYQFLNVAKNMTAHYLQTEDIIIEGEIAPLSVIAEQEFSGTYKTKNGDKKKINATVCGDGKYISLFGQIDSAVIDGVITEGSVTANGEYAAGLAGEIKDSVITNCENKMNVTSSSDYVGGIAGNVTESTLNNVANSGSINGNSIVGGIAGNVISTNITKSVNTGTVTAVKEIAAGIAANVASKLSANSNISECKNRGKISISGTAIDKQYVAGIAAKLMDTGATFTLNANYGEISATKYGAAGVAAYVQGAAVTKCYNEGKVIGNSYIAGIAAYGGSATVKVTDSMNTGIIDGGTTALAAGIFASGVAGNEVKNCINLGKVIGKGMYLYPIGDYKNVSTLTDNYYITPDTAYTNIFSGATEINIAGWSVLASAKQLPPGFSSEIWEYIEVSSSNKFPLPQIKGNGCPELAFTTVDAVFAGGAGIEKIPFEISNAQQLKKIADYPYAYYVLTNDIIEVNTVIPNFYGSLDGKGYEIDVNISSVENNIGLFAYVKGGTLKNIKLTGSVSGNGTVGGLAAKIEGTNVINCENSATVTGIGRMIGGIIGSIAASTSQASTVAGCINNGTVTGGAASRYVGGIAAANYDASAKISSCANNGDVSTGEYYPAGIVAYVNNGVNISECLNTGKISASASGAAGIVSQSYTGGVIITDCMNTGEIVSSTSVNTMTSGILALGHTSNSDKVSTSLNIGKITGKPDRVYPIGQAGIYENNVYLTPESSYQTTSAGATEINVTQWEEMAGSNTLPTGFSDKIWEYVEKTPGNSYPLLQLINNPYYKKGSLNVKFKAAENLGKMIPSQSVVHAAFDVIDSDDIMYTTVSGAKAVFNAYNITDEVLIGSHTLENAGNSWCHIVNPVDKMVYIIGSGCLFRYDPSSDTMTDLGDFSATEGASFIGTCDENGNIYIGTTTNAKIIKYDIETESFSDEGSVLSGATYVRSLNYLDGYLYCGIKGDGVVAFYKVNVEDFSDKEEIALPVSGDYSNDILDSVTWIYSGTVIGDKIALYVHTESKYILLVYDTVNEEFLRTGYDGGFKGLYTSPVKDGKSYFIGDKKIRYIDTLTGSVTSLDIQTEDSMYACGWITREGKEKLALLDTNNGNLIYYDLETGSRTEGINSADLETTYYTIQSIEAGDISGGDNAIYLGSYAGSSSVRYNLNDNSKIVFPSAQIEGMVSYEGKQYMGTYTKAGLYRFDRSLTVGDNNPEYLGKFGTNQDRPFALAADNDKIYIGTIPDYGFLGGELGEYDINEDKFTSYGEVIENQSIMSVCCKDGFIYGSTTVWGGLSATPDSSQVAKIFKFNPETQELVWSITPSLDSITDPLWIGGIAFDKNGKLWAVSGNTLFSLNTETRQVIDEIKFGNYTFSTTQHQWRPVYIRFDKNGNLYTNIDTIQIVNVDDSSERISLKELIVNKVNLFDLDLEGNIYYAKGDAMYLLEIE